MSVSDGEGPMKSEMSKAVNEFIALTMQIKESQSDLKVLRSRKSELMAQIKSFMRDHNLDVIHNKETGVDIALVHGKRRVQPRKCDLPHKMAEFLRDPERAQQLYDSIYTDLPLKETVSLRLKNMNNTKVFV